MLLLEMTLVLTVVFATWLSATFEPLEVLPGEHRYISNGSLDPASGT